MFLLISFFNRFSHEIRYFVRLYAAILNKYLKKNVYKEVETLGVSGWLYAV